MEWRVEYLEDYHVVELFMSGLLTGPDLMASVSDRMALGKQKGVTNFIINAKDLTAQRSAVTDVLKLPTQKYVDEKMGRDTKLAVLAPTDPDYTWLGEFYETVCVNRGWQAQICRDHDSAIHWLLNT
ncbi:MAG: hypothetical protein K0U72_03595 [Gammaproteobacteria bacterium]|nr:hypothetical protein [Gammaproteobacteria bacterium]